MTARTSATTASTFSAADLAERTVTGAPSRPSPGAYLYGPDKPLFDKTWVLPDIEKIG